MSDDENRPLRVLTEDEYDEVLKAARNAAYQRGRITVPPRVLEAAVDAVLIQTGVIYPPPEPEPDTCTALFATEHGWHQCGDDPGHDGMHDNGEWTWVDNDPNAIPAAPVQEDNA